MSSSRSSLSQGGPELAQRSAIAGAVQRVDGVVIRTDLARLIIHGLRGYTELATQRYGVAPEWVADVQYGLAESLADTRQHEPPTCDNSRQRELSSLKAAEILDSSQEFTTAEAAAALRISADLVRYHCRKGNLQRRKVGQQVMVSRSSVESFKHTRRSA
jgi:Helix-turn-helix domain